MSSSLTQSEGSAKADAKVKAKARGAGRTFEMGQHKLNSKNTARTMRDGAVAEDDDTFSSENPMRKSAAAAEDDDRFSNPMLAGQRLDGKSRSSAKPASPAEAPAKERVSTQRNLRQQPKPKRPLHRQVSLRRSDLEGAHV